MMTLLEKLAFVAGFVIPLGLFPQVYRIFKYKKASDFSLTTLLILFLGMLVFLAYSIELKNFILIMTYSLSSIAYGLILVGWYIYK